MSFLLDVNVLIALIDPAHVSHDAAHVWFEARQGQGWATCPITENGVIRIVGDRRYPNSPGSPATVADMMRSMRLLSDYQFWHDRISLVDASLVASSHILTPGQVTDTYLLALAKSYGGKLATFDRRLSTLAVPDGRETLHIIGVDDR